MLKMTKAGTFIIPHYPELGYMKKCILQVKKIKRRQKLIIRNQI